MRFPTIHTFLKWFGPSLVAFCGGSVGLIAALSVPFPRVKDWAEREFDIWWPYVSAPWFLASGAAIIAVYIMALIYTGGTPRPKKLRSQPVPKSWVEHAQNLPPPPASGTLLHEMEMQTALSKFPELQREKEIAFPLPQTEKWSAFYRLINGSWEDAAAKILKDREAEEEASRQRLIRQAKEPDDFSKAFKERSSDKIPYVRVREIALAKGVDLPRYGEHQNRSYDLEGELKDAAANGLLAVWGRPYNGEPRDNDPMLPIPADHFRKYSFRHGCLEMDMENKHSCTTTIAALTKGKEMTEGESYYDLHVAGIQAREIIDKFGEGLK
jgi:hypothetical protein